jgi:hypothetical protein
MRLRKRFRQVLSWLSLVAALAVCAAAQSTDQALPTPVFSNEISGRIKPLDLGDPRMTRHFYAFEGTPGDLLITVEGKNLNGDVDVFTAVTFRPLMKATFYADTQSPEVTKSLYLRATQILILRVEARTPNDDPGTYRIRFGGAFAKFSGGIPVAEPSEVDESEAERSSANRLSSVGATIPRPVEEKVEETKPETTTEETGPAKPEATPRRTTSRRTTSRNPRRTTRPAKKPPVKREPADSAKTEIKETEEKPSETADKEKSQEIVPQTVAGQLVVEKRDGTRIDRPMSSVRRVTIDGTAIVIVMKNGRIDRIPMSLVSRVGIEPQ